jgi:hypothetical protein
MPEIFGSSHNTAKTSCMKMPYVCPEFIMTASLPDILSSLYLSWFSTPTSINLLPVHGLFSKIQVFLSDISSKSDWMFLPNVSAVRVCLEILQMLRQFLQDQDSSNNQDFHPHSHPTTTAPRPFQGSNRSYCQAVVSVASHGYSIQETHVSAPVLLTLAIHLNCKRSRPV